MITSTSSILNILLLFIQLSSSFNQLILQCWVVQIARPLIVTVDATLLNSKSPPFFSASNTWISEELWPKEKSLIHIKIMKPFLKEISIWETRKKKNYLTDVSLDFDSAFKLIQVNACQILFKSVLEPDRNIPNQIIQYSGNIQVEIRGGSNCTQLPLSILSASASNITHLVIRETGIHNLTKYLFGKYKLDQLTRLDIISNLALKYIENRAFDGLTHLSYLSFINNEFISNVSVEAFAGLKNLEELIFLGNGQNWDQAYFNNLIRSASDRILPNLIHLHLCSTKVLSEKNMNVNTLTKVNHETKNNVVIVDQVLNKVKLKKNERELNKKSTSIGLKINKDDLKGLSQIRYLQLSDCDIHFIHPLALIPLAKKLIWLNLEHNTNLKSANLKQVFSYLYFLNEKWLYASKQNNISSSISSPSKVTIDRLDLSSSVTTFNPPKDLLTVISKTTISELYLSNVKWKKLNHGDIPPMPNLRVLHLEQSQIEHIDEKAFFGLEDLIKLSLKGNLIKHIPLYLLEPVRKLEYLDLSGYKTAHKRSQNLSRFHIEPKALIHVTSLKELNLNYKNLETLQRGLFLGLYKLEKLHLRGCNLKFIQYLTFFPLKSIIYIDLSSNRDLITSLRIYDDTFVGLEAVEMVRLSDCNITSNDINDFFLFRRLYEHIQLLDLSHNQINAINATTLKNFTELRHIDLSHNQIQSWNNYTIFSKNNFIVSLDISYNQLTHITPEMLGDFQQLKNLSFAFNPLQCGCDWEGPLLLLYRNQPNHAKFHYHLKQLVHRQQEIVSTAFASSKIPPKSIIEWLNTTSIHFLNDHHPLRSSQHYFCHTKSSNLVIFKDYFKQGCTNHEAYSRAKVNFTLLTVIACTLLLMTLTILVIAFIYNSTIRTLITVVDDDFLHNYQYDAFVSYNVNDSDWVFNKLVPSLEERSLDSVENGNEKSQRTHIKLCIYDRDFIAGRPISECITESIRSSRKVILVISNKFALSPWCRFETDLAHNTLLDQNREGLILIKLEEIDNEMLEKFAPQLHFLLKTRIYLSWSQDKKDQEIFWKKLRNALGFHKSATYGTVKQYYKTYVNSLTKDKSHNVMLPSAHVKVSFKKSSSLVDSKIRMLKKSKNDCLKKVGKEDEVKEENKETCFASMVCPLDMKDNLDKNLERCSKFCKNKNIKELEEIGIRKQTASGVSKIFNNDNCDDCNSDFKTHQNAEKVEKKLSTSSSISPSIVSSVSIYSQEENDLILDDSGQFETVIKCESKKLNVDSFNQTLSINLKIENNDLDDVKSDKKGKQKKGSVTSERNIKIDENDAIFNKFQSQSKRNVPKKHKKKNRGKRKKNRSKFR